MSGVYAAALDFGGLQEPPEESRLKLQTVSLRNRPVPDALVVFALQGEGGAPDFSTVPKEV